MHFAQPWLGTQHADVLSGMPHCLLPHRLFAQAVEDNNPLAEDGGVAMTPLQSAQANLLSAEANVRSAEAILRSFEAILNEELAKFLKAKAKGTPEEVVAAENKVATAKADVATAENKVEATKKALEAAKKEAKAANAVIAAGVGGPAEKAPGRMLLTLLPTRARILHTGRVWHGHTASSLLWCKWPAEYV